MTAAQLDLDCFRGDPTPSTKKKKASPLAKICACLHELRDHAGGKGPCSFGAHVGHPCTCKRFKSRARPVVATPTHLLPPPGSVVLERDDLQRPKRMGWAIVAARAITFYLEQLKTKSLNQNPTGFSDPRRMRFMFAALGAYKKACRGRVVSAIAQCGADVAARGKPSRVSITRVSSGSLDDDNLIGALKHVRDGIADALDFDDKLLAVRGGDAKLIPCVYLQEKPGARRVCGVRVQIDWEA